MDVFRTYFYLVGGISVVKANPGRVGKLCVCASSLTTAVGAMYDVNTTVSTSLGPQNQFAVIPFTAGNYSIDWSFLTALTVSVAPGQTIAISYE